MTPEPPEGYRLLTDKESEDGMTQEGDKLAVICGTDCEWIPVQEDKVMWPRMIYARRRVEQPANELAQLRAELTRIRAEVEAAPHAVSCDIHCSIIDEPELGCNCFKSRIL